MNILWLAPHPLPNDKNAHPGPWITALAKNLAAENISITIVLLTSGIQEEIQEFIQENYKLTAIRSPKISTDTLTFFNVRINKLASYLKMIIDDYDVVHVHGTEFQYASALRRISNQIVPVVISIQGLLSIYKKYIDDKLTARRILWEIGSYYEKKDIAKNTNFMCRTHWDKKNVRLLNDNANIYNVWEMLRDEFYQFKLETFGNDILFSGGRIH